MSRLLFDAFDEPIIKRLIRLLLLLGIGRRDSSG